MMHLSGTSFLLMSSVLLSGCLLESQKPHTEFKELDARDRLVSEQINEFLATSATIVQDLNRLSSYSLGVLGTEASGLTTMTDFPEYTALFEPVDAMALTWDPSAPLRFSREIWNGAVYVIQRKNPSFRLRAEGRLAQAESANPKVEALVLAIDLEGNVSAATSEAVLSVRKRCQNNSCSFSLRMDHKAISAIFSMYSDKKTPAVEGLGMLVAQVDEVKTTAKSDGLNLGLVTFSALNYTRERQSDVSNVEASGQLKIPNREPIDFQVRGNIREPSTLTVTRTSGISGVAP
jgi:hypothetical protein